MDLVIRGAQLRRTDGLRDIGIRGERIVEIAPGIAARAPREISADGRLVTPAFVNPHMHLDKCMVRDRMRPNATFSFDEAIELTWGFKRDRSVEDIRKTAVGVAEQAVANGTTHMRVFADVDTVGGLKPVTAMLAVREEMKDIIDIQVVAFPQEAIVRNPGSDALLDEAMRLGADVVGGLPWYEHCDADSQAQIDLCFALAQRYRKPIHMLVDDTSDPSKRTLEMLALKTIRAGLGQHVAASHCEAITFYDHAHAARVIALVKEAGMSIVSNAHISLTLIGIVGRPQPAPRGITRVWEFLRAGVNVASGQDDVNDPYYPFGRCDQLEVGWIMAHTAQLVFADDIETAYDLITTNAARVMGLTDYGLEVGKRADLVVLDAPNVKEAFRLQADRAYVIRKGRVVAETKTTRTVHRVR
jgi:cytosine deaminase